MVNTSIEFRSGLDSTKCPTLAKYWLNRRSQLIAKSARDPPPSPLLQRRPACPRLNALAIVGAYRHLNLLQSVGMKASIGAHDFNFGLKNIPPCIDCKKKCGTILNPPNPNELKAPTGARQMLSTVIAANFNSDQISLKDATDDTEIQKRKKVFADSMKNCLHYNFAQKIHITTLELRNDKRLLGLSFKRFDEMAQKTVQLFLRGDFSLRSHDTPNPTKENFHRFRRQFNFARLSTTDVSLRFSVRFIMYKNISLGKMNSLSTLTKVEASRSTVSPTIGLANSLRYRQSFIE
ncbi:hypothetical protein WN51_03573 [Melipona quadrifasciata]|uniref:Uncharacterized protein n=1 Tax=Melipona quadrifasciata TaxID=166423 RepID=A0A0N1ITA4_9HYME|nr:hypothetical protein WN51_03573 [Melipona quadrifasciata]